MDDLVEFWIIGEQSLDFVDGMDDGGVVFATEGEGFSLGPMKQLLAMWMKFHLKWITERGVDSR